ncbi:MAG: ABC transporter permease [Bacteroidota bacterium]|nr:ABC transporter permease [Bacteroidota bacterium]
MVSLLKTEWLKVKKYNTFWILSLLYIVSIWGLNYIVYNVQQNIYDKKKTGGVVNMIIGNPPYAFPKVWHMTAYVSSFLLFMPGLLMIISITNEYSYKTHRQNIIDGWSRTQFITAKQLLTIIIAIVSTAAVFLSALSFGFMEGSETLSFDNLEYILYFFLQTLSYTSLALLFGVVLKRSGIAIGVYFLYTVVIENVVSGLLNHYADYSGRYLPLKSVDNLIPFPVFENMTRQFLKQPNFSVQLTLSLIYLALYYYATKRKFETDDL